MATIINGISEIAMQLIKTGKIRNHKLLDHTCIHTEDIEKKGARIYRNFLPSKNCSIVYELTGRDNF